MSHKTVRAAGSVLVGTAVLVGAVGCARSEAVDPSAQRALDSVLTDGEFPSGYRVVELGKDDKSVITEQLDDSRKDAKVTPQACKSNEHAPDDADTGTAVAVDGDATLSQSVAESTVDAATLRAAVTGECSAVTVEITTGPADGTTVRIEHADVTTPSIDGRQGLVFTQVSTSTGDRSERREMLIGRVPVGGYLVTVQAVNANGSAPDRPAFDATLHAAVRKVAAVS